MMTMEEAAALPQVSVLLNIMQLFADDVYKHCISVATICRDLADEAEKFTEEQKDDIVIGALLHDIGKIFVPFNLTDCPRRLSDTEFEIVKIHTLIGYEILKKDFSKTVTNIALYHHERPNRTGYNNALPLSRIPKEALLVQVADIYDALVSERRYKNSYDACSAVDIMKNDSRRFMIDDEYFELLRSYLKKKELI